MQMWDTAGQERYQALCQSFYRGSDCCVIVYDVSADQSYLNCRRWLDNFRETQKQDIPVVIIGNKSDLEHKITDERVKAEWIDQQLAKGHFNTTASDNESVESAFKQIAAISMDFANQDQSNEISLKNKFFGQTEQQPVVKKNTGVSLTAQSKPDPISDSKCC